MGGTLSTAQAQIVIRERVEIEPLPTDEAPQGAQAAARTQDVVRGSGWPGGVRGRGTLRVSGLFTLWGGQGADVSASLIMSSGAQHALAPLSFASNLRRCSSDGTDESNGRRRFSVAERSFQVDSGEQIDSLVVSGTGVRLSLPESIDPPRTYFGNQWSGFLPSQGCAYGYSRSLSEPAACDCVEQNGGQSDGKASLSWTFEADPAEKFVVTASQDTVDYVGEGRNDYVTQLTAEAVYADGTPAPLDKNTPVTWSSTPTPYGSLQVLASRWPNREQARGTTWTTAYQRGDVIRLTADGVHADSVWTGGPPVCDTPVSVRANADGISGETTVVIRGTSTATEIEELVVTVSPDVLASGERAVVSAQAVTEDGCETLDLSPETPMDVVLSEDVGELVYDGMRGATLTVPYRALRSGEVEFEAAMPVGACGKAWIGVFGAEVSGQTIVDIRDSDGSVELKQSVVLREKLVYPDSANEDGAVSLALPSETCGGAPNWATIRLARALEVNPYGLLDIPCDQIAAWAEVGSHVPPIAVRARLESLEEGEPWWNSWYGNWNIQELTDATGTTVNMDYYAVTLRLPSGESAEDYFEHVRQKLDDFISDALAEFRPYAGEYDR